MKEKRIRFFSLEENKPAAAKEAPKPVVLTGSISAAGKIKIPSNAVEELGLEGDGIRFRVGVQEGKRKIKSLFLVPTDEAGDGFELEKGTRSYTIALAYILQKNGIDFSNTKYTFTIKPFNYSEGVTGYELQLDDQSPKPAYTGKPRGRKPKNKVAEGE